MRNRGVISSVDEKHFWAFIYIILKQIIIGYWWVNDWYKEVFLVGFSFWIWNENYLNIIAFTVSAFILHDISHQFCFQQKFSNYLCDSLELCDFILFHRLKLRYFNKSNIFYLSHLTTWVANNQKLNLSSNNKPWLSNPSHVHNYYNLERSTTDICCIFIGLLFTITLIVLSFVLYNAGISYQI